MRASVLGTPRIVSHGAQTHLGPSGVVDPELRDVDDVAEPAGANRHGTRAAHPLGYLGVDADREEFTRRGGVAHARLMGRPM